MADEAAVKALSNDVYGIKIDEFTLGILYRKDRYDKRISFLRDTLLEAVQIDNKLTGDDL